ncbi:hypothetical protein ACROSR_08830 [Roseovarius tibetensis]|uniref:hypothetical protein n=1 Tax=Roseovarius tibetensis TaxID=2685897 RepID=UPI003D7F49F2
MTVATIFAGLGLIMCGDVTGSEVMRRIAAPMIGGMATATLLTRFVILAILVIWKRLALTRIYRQTLQPPPGYQPAARRMAGPRVPRSRTKELIRKLVLALATGRRPHSGQAPRPATSTSAVCALHP